VVTDYAGRVAFGVGTGRCGTTFLTEVAGREPDVAASHERLRLAATFHMFCKWHHIAIDPEGFLLDREEAVRRDLAEKGFSFECSALISHSLEELFARFRAKFLLLVRAPDETVASFAVRGWFLKPIARGDATLPPSYREGEEPRHFFGRNIPHGVAFERWLGLSQIGKLAWFWQARNRAILEQFARLPAAHCRIVRLEDLDHAHYQDVAAFLGWRSRVDAATFAELAKSRPNAGPNAPRTCDAWTPAEAAEFEAEVGSLAEALGYEHRVSRLVARPASRAEAPLPALADVLTRAFG